MTRELAVLIGLVVLNLLGLIVYTTTTYVVFMAGHECGHETLLPPLEEERS